MIDLATPLIAMRRRIVGSHMLATGKHYGRVFSPVLLGLAGMLAMADPADSEQHLLWAGTLLLAVAAFCTGSGWGEFPYEPMIAILSLPVATVIASLKPRPSLRVGIAAVTGNGRRVHRRHRKGAEQPGEAAPKAQLLHEQNKRCAMRLLAAASHDLRLPVQALVAQVDLMEGKGAGRGAYLSPRQLTELQTSVNTLAEMLDDLFDVNRVNMGIHEASLQPVNVRCLLQEAGQVFAANANAKGLHLRVECPGDVWVTSDPKLLRRMLFNLTANAVRYTDAGGIRLNCLVAEGRVTLRTEDTGRGMNAADIAAKGTEFELRPTTSRQGLGLGLGIASTMAHQLGHTLKVASELGEGTQIDVELGECLAAAPSTEQPCIAAPPLNADITVAIVEDDAAVLKALVNVIASWGCRTVSADSGHKLVAQLRCLGAAPHLVIADLNLEATETGLDLIRTVRDIHRGAEIPAIVLTGDVRLESKHDAALSGIQVLCKPVRPPDLRKLVTELVLVKPVA